MESSTDWRDNEQRRDRNHAQEKRGNNENDEERVWKIKRQKGGSEGRQPQWANRGNESKSEVDRDKEGEQDRDQGWGGIICPRSVARWAWLGCFTACLVFNVLWLIMVASEEQRRSRRDEITSNTDLNSLFGSRCMWLQPRLPSVFVWGWERVNGFWSWSCAHACV